MSVRKAWSRIEAWLSDFAGELTLPGPASEEAIAATEEKIGFKLPADLRESYAIHDGMEYGDDELHIIPAGEDAMDTMAFCLLPVASIADEWAVWKELIDGGDFEGEEATPDPGIVNAWWSNGWIPVAGNGGGDFVCVDAEPAEGGKVGQVICAWHDMDDRKLLAPSWGKFLESIADEMESGVLTWDDDEGVVRG